MRKRDWFLVFLVGCYAIAAGLNCYAQYRLAVAQDALTEAKRELLEYRRQHANR